MHCPAVVEAEQLDTTRRTSEILNMSDFSLMFRISQKQLTMSKRILTKSGGSGIGGVAHGHAHGRALGRMLGATLRVAFVNSRIPKFTASL